MTQQPTPLVSCIMPTANREKFIPFSIDYYLRQSYKNTELIIVDDGTNPVADMIPEDPRIKYVRTPQKATIGAKRNYACEMAKGDIILHWDDDDWYTENWINHQVLTMLFSGAEICGLSQVLFYAPSIARSWKYIYPPTDRPWVAGATMAYTKDIWSRNPFRDVQVGEDNEFAWNSGGKVFAHSYLGGFVSILHPNNTSPKYTNDIRWTHFNNDEVAMILDKDLKNYI